MISSNKAFPGILILALLLFFLFAPACTPPQKPVMGFHPVLSLSEAPVSGKPVKVTLTFESSAMKGLEGKKTYYFARIAITPGFFELVEGNLETKGENIPGETHTIEATIKSTRTTGGDAIYGRVTLLFSPDETRGGSGWDEDVLFITFTKDCAKVNRNQPNNEPPKQNGTTMPAK
jgi:hypothetical protein